jgi:hypothetical protein
MKKLLFSALLVLTPLCVATLTFSQANNDPAVCQQTIKDTCTKCHNTDRICKKLGETDTDWPKLVNKMADKGNLGKDAQGAVLDCLTKSADPAQLVCRKK